MRACERTRTQLHACTQTHSHKHTRTHAHTRTHTYTHAEMKMLQMLGIILQCLLTYCKRSVTCCQCLNAKIWLRVANAW